ncbi:MAG: nucleoporin [Archangium sp.]|nr:nucleoporin [Archangium sp.]
MGSTTMMFGSQPPPPAAPAKNTTMMFGTPGSNTAPPPAAPQAPPSARNTMMFGTPPPAPAAPKNQTMMFGTPVSNAAPPPPAAPPPASKATMVFGAPPAAPAAAAKNQTMMFGTPASNAASAAPPPPPAAPNPRQTMVFGASPVAPPPAAKQTMVFGTAASNAAAANAPQAAAPASKQTMVFGAPAPAAPKNQTMMFGTPASNAVSDGNVVSEGSEETIMDMPGQSSRTVLFGQPPAGQEPEAPEPAPAKNQTMMFGRPAAIPKVTAGVVELAGMSANEGAPNESTVRVDVAQVIEEHGDDPAPEMPRHDRTQRFAMTESGGLTPPEGQSPVQDRHNRTQLFAMSTSPDRTLPIAGPDDGASSVFVGETTLPPGAMPPFGTAARMDLSSTLPPDPIMMDPPGVSLLHDPANMTPPEAQPAAESPVATTLPNLPMLRERPMAPLSLELPPEPMGSPQDLRVPPPQSQQAAHEDAAALRAARGGGAGRAIVVILIIVAIVLAGVLVYRLFGRDLLGSAVPVEAIQTTEQALATLRLDDQASQEKAVAQLTSVLAAHPGLPETQGALVIAMALRLDDVQGQVTRAASTLRSLKSNEGPAGDIAKLEAKIAANEVAAKELKTQLEAGVAALQSLTPNVVAGTSAHLAMIRADGLARGVLGDAEALTRPVAYKQRTETRDDWVDLIEPEYALNGGSSVDEAIAQLIALKARGSNKTFLRPYVLLARLQLKKGEAQAAREELEQVTTMNSRHEIARELLASIAK